MTVVVGANRTTTGARAGATTQEAAYSFVDTGEWALVTVPTLSTGWGWRGVETVELDESVTIAGEGSTGGEIAYLGPVTEHTRTANGQTFTLAVPERASLLESPDAVLDALAEASERLRVGARDPRVWMAAAPTSVDWGVRGVEYGGDDAWVTADASLSEPGVVWLHEYVHTRQAYETAASGKWTVEASAEYYSGLLALQMDFVDFDTFQTFLSYGTRDPWRDAILSQPSTWPSGANYLKGSLVWGAIDRRLRLATDSSVTASEVLWSLNRHDDPVTNDDVLHAIVNASTADAGQYAQRYTATRAAPEVWSRLQHARAFGTEPPRMTYEIQQYHVSGPFRDATFDEPPVLYVGETLTVTAMVENEGGTAGAYEATFTLGDRTVADAGRRLAPGATDAFTLQHRFTGDGDYNLTVGRNPIPVAVREPATPTVTGLSVSPEDASPGDTVTATVTLSNPTDGPATGSVPVLFGDREVASVDATLAAGESVDRTVTVTVPENGGDLVVGDQTVTLATGSAASTPGFGVGATVAALAAAALVATRRA
jgi:PGF-CTERM protein